MHLRPARTWQHLLWLLLLLLPALTVPGHAAKALGCSSVSTARLNLGTLNPLSGGPYYASGTTSLGCYGTGGAAQTVYACLSIGNGNGGTGPAGRQLISGSYRLGIGIYPSASSSTQIGDGTSDPMDGPFSLLVPGKGRQSVSVPLVVALQTPQDGGPGGYYALFQGSDFIFYWSQAPASSCNQLVASGPQSVTGTMVINAQVPASCGVTATPLSFGSVADLLIARSAVASVTVTCNARATYTVALDNGASGTGPTSRHMTSGTRSVLYGLYQDSADTTPWGSGTQAVTGTLTSAGSAALPVYGLVPAQTTPRAGTYTDAVTITVTY